VIKVYRERWDHEVFKVQSVSKVKEEKEGYRETLERLDRKEKEVYKVYREKKEIQENEVKKVRQEKLDLEA
jgi:cell shape-determining protein MreC